MHTSSASGSRGCTSCIIGFCVGWFQPDVHGCVCQFSVGMFSRKLKSELFWLAAVNRGLNKQVFFN